MTQAQLAARRRIDATLNSPLLRGRLAEVTIKELKTLKRKGKNPEYAFTLHEQVTIEVAYEMTDE